jgi:undecaprenyl diphosphate synthase
MDNSIPKHVAIIPDGNRRWAKARGKIAYYGHKSGLDIFEEIALHGLDAGVQHISVWGMSADNIKNRSKTEITGLLALFRSHFQSLLESEEIDDRKVKINVFGQWEKKFPTVVKKPMYEAIAATKKYKEHSLNFLLAYNGTDEMLQSIQAITDLARSGKGPKKVTPALIKKNLYTKDLPPVDLVIRTAGDPHLSNGFMMWDVADAELFFSDKLWPDFNKKEFNKALKNYGDRRRKRGS